MNQEFLPILITFFLVFFSAIAGAIFASKLRLPLMVGYIASGVFIGNIFTKFIDGPVISNIGDIGVTLLMFSLGIEFSMQRLRRHMSTILGIAVIQIFVLAFGFCALFMVLGMTFFASLITAIAVSLSSTAVVLRILSEKGELDTAHGELLTAWLVVQDLSVIPMMLLLPVMHTIGTTDSSISSAITTIIPEIAKSIGVIMLVFILGRFIVPRALSRLADLHSREVLVLASASLVFVSGVLFLLFGLSSALGAFVAGILIAETSEKHEIFSDIRPLRDLFAAVFFVSIGLALPIVQIVPSLLKIFIAFLAIMVVKWSFVYLLCRFIGLHKKTSVIVGIGLIPMSEFGFILAREGVAIGSITQEQYLFLVALTFITIIAGAPLLSRSYIVYEWFKKTLGKILPPVFVTKIEKNQSREQLDIQDHVVICGYGRVGKYVGRSLEMAGIPFVVVDYDHQTIMKLKERGIRGLYGDPSDFGVLDIAQVDLAKSIVIAIPDKHSQESIITHALTLNAHISIICRTHHESDLRSLRALGVGSIIQPEFEAALSIVKKLLREFGTQEADIQGKVARLKIEHGIG